MYQSTLRELGPTPGKIDTGLACLVFAVRLLGIPADQSQLARAYAVDSMGIDTLYLVRAAKDLGLKARLISLSSTRLNKISLPAIAVMHDGTFVVLTKYENEKFVIFDPEYSRPLSVDLKSFCDNWSGEVILLAKRISLKGAIESFGLAWFIPVVMRYKKAFFQVMGLSMFLQLFGLISPMFMQVIIDKVLVHRSLNTLNILVIGMLIISVFQVVFSILRGYVFTQTANQVDVELNAKLFRHITALPMKFFENWQAGDIVARVKEVETVRQFITSSGLSILLDTIFAIVYIFFMLSYSLTLSLVAMFTIVAFAILNLIAAPIYKKCLQERFLIGSQNQAFMIETLTGIQTLKALGIEANSVQKWEQMQANYINSNFKTINIANIAGNVGQYIQSLFTLTVLWIGAHAVMDGDLTVGQLVAFQMLAGLVIAPILRVVNMWQYFQQISVSVERLGDVMNAPAEPLFNPNRTTLPTIKGDILLDHVTFRYREDTSPILNQISLHIEPGSKVGIVGRSGSGKSTLTKIIQRLYLPETGRVLIDGVDLAQVEPAWLRRQVGVVLQENFLFSGTVKENIGIARSDATMEEIIAVATLAGADRFITKLPSGYDTHVGERGTSLSGGQRQMIAIARALLTDPRLVIFDEATSSLDYESEREILDNFEQITKGRTAIIIAHRLSTIRGCDQIFFIDHGRIVEQGTHNSLMRARGVYYSLYNEHG